MARVVLTSGPDRSILRDMAVPYVSGPVLYADDGVEVEYDNVRQAIAALRWVRDQVGVEAVFSCGWLVDVGCEDGSWVIPCGDVAVGTARGWHGHCGHAHVSPGVRFEEGWDYVTQEDYDDMRRSGALPSFIPVVD